MKVLVVDDDRFIAHLIGITLAGDDIETIEWTDDFDLIAERAPWGEIDSVIVDQLLGIYDGRQLLKWLKQEHPQIRRVMLTADSRVDPATTYADTVLIKPASPDVLRDAISG